MTTSVPSGIKVIVQFCTQLAHGRFNAPESSSPRMVEMISGQRSSRQAAGSTSQATSWPLDHWIGMRYSARMMMMRTGRILEHQAVGGALLAMLRLWCYRYTARLIQDHSIIQIWILNLNSWYSTPISYMDQPSRSVHLNGNVLITLPSHISTNGSNQAEQR